MHQKPISRPTILAVTSLLLAACTATPNTAASSSPKTPDHTEVGNALIDHPKLTPIERQTLRLKTGYHASQKPLNDHTTEYSIQWTARDHRVDLTWQGGPQDARTGIVRRFALPH